MISFTTNRIHKFRAFAFLLGVRMSCEVFAQTNSAVENSALEPRRSIAGQQAYEELRSEVTNQDYNIRYGNIGIRTETSLTVAYTDNVFVSPTDKRDDFILRPEFNLGVLVPVTELNVLNLNVGLSYEWFADNHQLNGNVPLVSPDSELQFHIFAGDFHIKLREKFSYQQTLVFDTQTAGERVFNFSDVGRFDRLNNIVGAAVDWDLNKVILSATYDHENFISMTDRFNYLDRASEWFTFTFNYLLGDKTKTGLETQTALHDFDTETVLNDSWRARVGPFAEARLPEGMTLRGGGGYDMARFDDLAGPGNDYDTWYAYGRLQQELRWFTHTLSAGRETLVGDNANNLRINYVRYSISSDAIKDVTFKADFSADFSKESGGGFFEEFTFYTADFHVGYPFHKHFIAGAGYELLWKDSQTPDRSYHRDLVSLDLTFAF